MEKSRVLPVFSVGRFMDSVSKGNAQKGRLEEGERSEKERVEAERRKKREEETGYWTTPGLRPLAEPPVLDWDYFFRAFIPSDLRYKALFPSDPEKRAKMKDLGGEHLALYEYSLCAEAMSHSTEMDIARGEFYKNLAADIYEDWKEVDRERKNIYFRATELARFEFERLDNDGRTTKLEHWIEEGANVFYKWDAEVKEKYQHLVPSNFVENGLATFECHWFDWAGGVTRMQESMAEGRDILADWPQDVQEKYGHLRRYLPPERHRDGQSRISSSISEKKSRRGISFKRAGRFPLRTRIGYQPRGIERGLRVFRGRCRSTTIA